MVIIIYNKNAETCGDAIVEPLKILFCEFSKSGHVSYPVEKS